MVKGNLFSFVTRLDVFGRDIPGFNIKGKRKVNTCLGSFVSIGIFIVMLLYATHNAIILYENKNPSVNQYEVIEYFDQSR